MNIKISDNFKNILNEIRVHIPNSYTNEYVEGYNVYVFENPLSNEIIEFDFKNNKCLLYDSKSDTTIICNKESIVRNTKAIKST